MSLTYVFIKAICLSSYHWRCKWKYPTLKNSRTSVNSDKDKKLKSITGSFDLNWMKDTHTAVLIQFIVCSVVFLIVRYLSKMVRRLGLGEFFPFVSFSTVPSVNVVQDMPSVCSHLPWLCHSCKFSCPQTSIAASPHSWILIIHFQGPFSSTSIFSCARPARAALWLLLSLHGTKGPDGEVVSICQVKLNIGRGLVKSGVELEEGVVLWFESFHFSPFTAGKKHSHKYF